MTEQLSIFKSHEWWGQFFPPDDFESRFGGKIVYSAASGVRLTYVIPGFEQTKSSESLDGILSEGWPCSLLGPISDSDAGFAQRGGLSSRLGKAPFYFLVRGGHWRPSDKVRVLKFSVTGLQDFFFPKGHKEQVKYERGALQSVDLPFGKLEVYQRASFGVLPRDITSQIFSINESALQELASAIDAIYAKHTRAGFMWKKDISFELRISFNEPSILHDAYRFVKETAELLAVLLYRPCHVEWLKLVDERGPNPTDLDVLPALRLNKSTVDICTSEVSHFRLPITAKNVNLAALLGKWFLLPERYGTVVAALQHEVGFRTDHTLAGDIMLHAAQLEAIASNAGRHREKYTYPLSTHSGSDLIDAMKDILGVASVEAIGTAISALRNEIAHIERPKVLMKKLASTGVLRVARCLELVVIGSVLDSIGVPTEIRSEYQRLHLL